MPDKKEETEKVKHTSVYSALSAFQGEVKNIKHRGLVDYFSKRTQERIKFTYAQLVDIIEAISPLLSKHGLSHHFEITKDGKGIECFIIHDTYKEELKVVRRITSVETQEDGTKKEVVTEEFELVKTGVITSGVIPLDLTKPDMKDVGGQLTYGRRYLLGMVLGIATEEDKETALIEETNQNVKSFAFTQIKKTIDSLKDKEQLETQKKYLENELSIAVALDKGEAKRAPSLGLTVEQYEELLKSVQARIEGLDVNVEE